MLIPTIPQRLSHASIKKSFSLTLNNLCRKNKQPRSKNIPPIPKRITDRQTGSILSPLHIVNYHDVTSCNSDTIFACFASPISNKIRKNYLKR